MPTPQNTHATAARGGPGILRILPAGLFCFLSDPPSLILGLDTATGGERRILSGHRGPVISLAWSADCRILISASHDTTALVWDATVLSSDPPSAKKLSPADLESLWSDLAGPATSRTHRAVWMLASNPEQAIPFLRERVRPVPAVDPKIIDRLLADLSVLNNPVVGLGDRGVKLGNTPRKSLRVRQETANANRP